MTAEDWLAVPRAVERAHRSFLDLLQAELNSIGAAELNAQAALILLTIGNNEVPLKDLTLHGSRATIANTIRKLTETGHLEQMRAVSDRRAVRVRATAAARRICAALHQRLGNVRCSDAEEEEPRERAVTLRTLRRIERVWDERLRYGAD